MPANETAAKSNTLTRLSVKFIFEEGLKGAESKRVYPVGKTVTGR
jgi:hypothetical protein